LLLLLLPCFISASTLIIQTQPKPNKQTTSKMPHPQLLEVAADLVRKADMKQSYLKYLRGLVNMYKSKVLTLKISLASSTDENEKLKMLSIKEQERIQAMLTHLHNGNRAKYEEYKMKAKKTMSDLLTMMMEADELTTQILSCVPNSITLDGRTLIVDLRPTGDVVRNEQVALRQGEKMKVFDENLEFYDASAEFLELYK